MRILIDGDACPVIEIAERIAEENSVPVIIFCDSSHLIRSDYARVITVDEGLDSADFALINEVKKGDIIVTQDYGVATLGLSKGAFPIHQSGKVFTSGEIDTLLYTRYLGGKERRSKKSHIKGPKKRRAKDDEEFERSFRELLEKAIKEQ